MTAPLASLADLKSELNITGTADDARLTRLLLTAESALGAVYALPTITPRDGSGVAVASARTVFADGRFVALSECVSVSSIADAGGVALTFSEYHGRGTHLLGVYLTSRHCGPVTVTGVWGFDACPPDVVAAIVSCAAAAWKSSNLQSGEYGSLGDVGRFITAKAHEIMRARRVVVM
jgi:hypothetical protein